MNRLIILFFVMALACNVPTEKGHSSANNLNSTSLLIPTFKNLSIDVRIKQAVEEFIEDDTCASCIHEIYIDKIRPPRTEIILKSRVFSSEYIKNCNPLFIAKISGVDFYVFSGIEDIFIGDKDRMPNSGKDSGNTTFKVWTLILLRDSNSIEIIKDVGQPFFPYTVPNIEIKK